MHTAIDLTALAFNFSGIEQYAFRITRELVKIEDGSHYTLLFYGKPFAQLEETLQSSCVQPLVLPARHTNKLLVTQLDVPRQLRKLKADAYLFPAFPQPLTFCSNRSITVIHDIAFWDCPDTFTKASLLYWRTSTRHATKRLPVVTVSDFSKTRLCHRLGLPESHVRVVPNGIDEMFRMAQASTESQDAHTVRAKYQLPTRFILSLCTLEPRKNLSQLVNAWIEARSTHDNVPDLVLAGRKGWMVDELLSKVPSSLHAHIHLTGFVDNDDLPHLYQMCDKFVCPSRYEGFGLPPLEALAAGASVLCSDIPVFHETCGSLVRFFPVGDPHALASLLSTSLNKPTDEQIDELCQRYSWRRSAQAMHEVLVDKTRA